LLDLPLIHTHQTSGYFEILRKLASLSIQSCVGVEEKYEEVYDQQALGNIVFLKHPMMKT
jgi:hypothetical protein